jgi:hypothetical protein
MRRKPKTGACPSIAPRHGAECLLGIWEESAFGKNNNSSAFRFVVVVDGKLGSLRLQLARQEFCTYFRSSGCVR